LVSASRVIFCEPVWKADVEAQAVKVIVIAMLPKKNLVDESTQQYSESIESARPNQSLASHERPSPFLTLTPFSHAVKTLAIRNSAEELMISRRAQLKGQDQKVSSSLTDDFTMRNFISVGLLPSFQQEQEESHLSPP
jgi:hypothetical protein